MLDIKQIQEIIPHRSRFCSWTGSRNSRAAYGRRDQECQHE